MRTLLSFFFALAISVSAYAQMPTTGLKAYWPFSGGTEDAIGEMDASIVGNVLPAADRFGEDGCAYSFDGSQTSFMALEASEDLDVSPDSVLSISLWYQGASDDAGDFEILFLKYGWGFNPLASPGYALSLYDLNKVLMQADMHSLWLDDGIIPFPSENLWHHVVGVFTPGHWKMYLDNVLVNELIDETATIGQWESAVVLGLGFEGVMDDIAFYHHALDANEVNDLFNMPSACTVDVAEFLDDKKFLVYPNPTSDIVHIESSENEVIDQVQIHSLFGELIMQEDISNVSHSIVTSTLSPGIYLISLTQMSVTKYQKRLVIK